MVDWRFLENPELKNYFKKIVEYCDKVTKENKPWKDFESSDVGVPPWVLRKMVYNYDVLKVTYKSSSHTCYWLNVPLEEAKKALEGFEVAREPAPFKGEKTPTIPPDFLDIVEGYEDLKELIVRSVQADRPVHVLLLGPAATAKSLILYEIERLEGSVFVLGGTASKVGIRDVIVEKTPRFLIIDELDKIADVRDVSVLLTWMESGRAVVTIHNRRVEVTGKGWVFAAANRIDVLEKRMPELLSRFVVIKLRPYDRETFARVVKSMLVKREGVEEPLASYIAEKVAAYSRDPRDAVKVARLAKTREDVDKYVEIIRKYS